MKVYSSEIEVPRPADLGVTGGTWKLRKLTELTVIFGKNGSGKSRLLRAWRDLSPNLYHYIVPERVGVLSFEAGYLQEQMNAERRKVVSGRNFATDYRQHIITRIQAYFLVRGSVRYDALPGDPAELEQLLLTLLPDFALTIDGKGNPPYELVRVSNGQDVENIDGLSSGEAQILTVALDVLTIAAMWDIAKTERRIVLIDEPDAHIHPDLQVRFADFLVRVANRFSLQVIIATHSTTLLAALGQFGGASASVIYLDRTRSKFDAVAFSKEAKELAACLGGHAMMGPLFGVPLLLVEGDDDYRIWSQVPRHHVVSFAARRYLTRCANPEASQVSP
jgi:energy-coupling factor transporter ATP-binding protein EcfA2